jgi:hypothetical protein
MLNMGNETKTYSMFLGRPWLKHAKENHNQWDNDENVYYIVSKQPTMKTMYMYGGWSHGN